MALAYPCLGSLAQGGDGHPRVPITVACGLPYTMRGWTVPYLRCVDGIASPSSIGPTDVGTAGSKTRDNVPLGWAGTRLCC